MLRAWQKDALKSAINKYRHTGRHFFCQATPGAGKTVYASEVAGYLLEHEMVDLVLCLAPSNAICDGIQQTFSKRLTKPFKGGLGDVGQVITYQALQFLPEDFWFSLKGKRVFVVVDEVHHCSGSDQSEGNSWGSQIVSKIQNLATYTLALSGTPWRSDFVPIVLSQYTDPEGKLVVDYQYSLKQAVADRVCRSPSVVLVDNERLSIAGDNGSESFSSILDYVKRSKASYKSLLYNQDAMSHVLKLGCEKLEEIRQTSPNAGGLVVAASVAHAKLIQAKLIEKFNQSAVIVTYHNDRPGKDIAAFRQGNTQWIVSVGMVSEGTDIPRLQVCCHLSTIKTELYFRQVLGRILRITKSQNQQAWLFTFAEENLSKFAERIEEDIPESFHYLKVTEWETDTANKTNEGVVISRETPQTQSSSSLIWGESYTQVATSTHEVNLTELKLGHFKQRVISAFL
ncbi:DEAD/DEAH box helicase family protein [Vibrio sp. FNV 38]|nr:DEAD/DEAH box helicase family protein [Vibrio sp. FNV 38]